MSLLDPLRKAMSGYQRQTHLSLAGSLSEVTQNHFWPEFGAFSAYSSAGPRFSHLEQYDPIIAAYESNVPEYSPPAPWFEGMTHLKSPPERFASDWLPPTDRQDPVQYQDSLMTPGLFQHLLEEVFMDGPVPPTDETGQPEVAHTTENTASPQSRSSQSFWDAPEPEHERPLSDSRQAASDTYGTMMAQAPEPYEPLDHMASQESTLRATSDPQPQQDLETLIGLQAQEVRFGMERIMCDQQMQQTEQVPNPSMTPDFEPRQ